MIYLTWPRLPTILPDSGSYLFFNPIRTAFYPVFLDVIGMISERHELIIFIQISIYLSSYIYFLYIILEKIKSLSLFIFVGTCTSLNIYIHSFHSVILTESITFSIMNFYAAFLVKLFLSQNNNELKKSIWFQGLVGLYCIRPAMVTFIPSTIILIMMAAQ